MSKQRTHTPYGVCWKNMTNIKKVADRAGVELTDEIEFFAELLAEECAEIAEDSWAVNLPAGPVIRRHYNLIEKKG